jgi:predicted permease
MTTLGHDLRVACRGLAKQPGFALMTVGILTVGIAGMTTVFSLFNGLFLRPFPVPNQQRIVDLYETDRKTGTQNVGIAYSHFDAWRQYNQTFERMGFCSFWGANLAVGDKAERVSIRLATHDFLGVLGLRPVLGRYFTPEEDRQGGPNVVVVSFGLWERLFAKDPAVIGRVLQLDNDPYTVVGVLPPEADFPEAKDIWEPLRPNAAGGHGGMGALALGLLKEGVTVEQARQDLARIHQGWIEQHAAKEATIQPAVTLLREEYRQILRYYRFGSAILLVVVGFAMLTACCNVMSIMLARGAYRSKEFAMCAALGATRGRIIRQVLIESLLLSAAGGWFGVLLGNWALNLLLSRLGHEIPAWMKFEPDLRCGIFCVAIVAASTILSGLLPALHAAFPRDLHAVLQATGTRSTLSRGRRRTLNTIVTTEIALASMLLIGAGLLLRTFHQVQSIDPGFRKAGVLTYNISLPIGPYFGADKRRAFWDEHLERIRALPGVTHAALSTYLPMAWASFGQFEIEGEAAPEAGRALPSALTQTITPGYFEALGIRLLAGRFLLDQDSRKDSEPVAIVNETFARRFWPGQDPLDKRIRSPHAQSWIRVVGVVGDVIDSGLDRTPGPGIYLPVTSDVPFGMFGVVQTSDDPLALMASVRQVVHAADSALPIQDIRSMSQRVQESLWLRWIISWLFGAPAAAAGIMALAGIYGVISYSVSRRIQEIGIRVALGARMPDVLKMVMGQGLRLILVGLGLGVAGGFILGHLFASIPGMLYNISPVDPATFAGGLVLLTAVALLACYVPARRAAKTDPMVALRYE